MFELAFKNQSTGPSYLVINAINEIDNTEKEICTTSTDLYWALMMEYPKCIDKIDSLGFANSNSRTFYFANINALNKIDYYNYDESILNKLKPEINNSIWKKISREAIQIQKRQIKPKHNSRKTFHLYSYLNEYGIYFIHLMFVKGILTGSSCLDGSLIINKVFQTST